MSHIYKSLDDAKAALKRTGEEMKKKGSRSALDLSYLRLRAAEMSREVLRRYSSAFHTSTLKPMTCRA